ncbi:hypothetical protein [Devosia sp.]
MANVDIEAVRRHARTSDHVQRAHIMLYAAGLASLTIVAVAATIMTTLF